MNNHLDRIQHFRGTPYEIGLAAGRALGAKLEYTIDTYIAGRAHASDMKKLHQGALPWLRRLPKRFQEEYEGLAEGAQLLLQRLVENLYTAAKAPSMPADLIRILADDKIERRNQELVTAYANVACPASGELWYTFGGYPAASTGNWQRLAWPWSA